MILYDVMAEGFHTPLTREKIADLFQAGRINRSSPCKLAVKPEWRTVDELFPLLKHNSPWDSTPSRESGSHRRWIVAGVGLAAFAIAAGVAAVVSFRTPEPEIAAAQRAPRALAANRSVTAAPQMYAISAPAQAPRSSRPLPASSFARPTSTAPPRSKVDLGAQRARFEPQRLAREQLQREQAANAERMRQENERREAERIRAAGIDTIIPLDSYSPVNVGGWSVNVKVHDNDVTSFDVWIDGRWYRDVKKEKGINGTRTEETYIYSNGRATLYYVWELSGKLNHCRLRVREG